MAAEGYTHELPSEQEVGQRLSKLVEYWQPRDDLIAKLRDHLEGRNPIPAPTEAQFHVVVKHAFELKASFNEKFARFKRHPEYAVVAEKKGRIASARKTANDIEEALNRVSELLEITSDADVWGKVKEDAIVLDAGVERIECIVNELWPDLKVGADGMDRFLRESREEVYGGDEEGVTAGYAAKYLAWTAECEMCEAMRQPKPPAPRDPEDDVEERYERKKDEYKRGITGIPVRSVYVPLENWWPNYDGPRLIESFEAEVRSVRSVRENPLFDTAALSGNYRDGDATAKCVILHYANHKYHAYYVLAPVSDYDNRWPTTVNAATLRGGCQPRLLYAYEHGLDGLPYNVVGGRFGGWKGVQNRISGVMTAAMAISQEMDEIKSQMATYLYNLNWPTKVVYLDPEGRGQTGDDLLRNPIKVKPGQNLVMLKGESMEPLIKDRPNQETQWYYNELKEQLSHLLGAPVLYGQHTPGVESGYHERMQVGTAKSIDGAMEANIAYGAKTRAFLVLGHLRNLKEKTPIFHASKDTRGNVTGRYITIDPDDLLTMPQIDAKVIEPDPIDYPVAIRAFIEATTANNGPGSQLMSVETASELIGGIKDVQYENFKKMYEEQQRAAIPFITQKVAEKAALMLAQQSTPAVGPEQAMGADPALHAALQGLNSQPGGPGPGGVSPETLGMLAGAQAANGMVPPPPGPGQGVGGGLPPGMPQPEAALGRAQQLSGAGVM